MIPVCVVVDDLAGTTNAVQAATLFDQLGCLGGPAPCFCTRTDIPRRTTRRKSKRGGTVCLANGEGMGAAGVSHNTAWLVEVEQDWEVSPQSCGVQELDEG